MQSKQTNDDETIEHSMSLGTFNKLCCVFQSEHRFKNSSKDHQRCHGYFVNKLIINSIHLFSENGRYLLNRSQNWIKVIRNSIDWDLAMLMLLF